MSRTILCCLLLAACGNITRKSHDGGLGSDDASMTDGAMNDAPVDAFVQLPATPAREVVSGAGHMSGATFSLDVEVGVPFQPQKATGSIHTIQPNTAVQP
jgi:hypothetical protein